jgi:tetratricopeptide (TPR) repeat protein
MDEPQANEPQIHNSKAKAARWLNSDQDPMKEPQNHNRPAKTRSRGVPRWPPVVALLNASGLGLGYLYMKTWGRWGLHAAVTAMLISIPLCGGGPLGLVALGLWGAWMILDGWLQARRLIQASPEAVVKKNAWMLVLAGGLTALILLPFLTYNVLGAVAGFKAEAAYRSGDYRTVYETYESGSRVYGMAFTFDKSLANKRVAALGNLMAGSAARDKKDYEEAVRQYAAYLSIRPPDAVWTTADGELQQVYLEWARALAGEKKFEEAIGVYDTYLKEYPQGTFAAEAETEVEQAYLGWARDLAAQEDYEQSIRVYLAYLDKYPQGSLRGEAERELEESRFNRAHAALEQGDHQNAVEYYVSYLLYYPQGAFKTEAESELEQARLGLARDTAAQGNFEDAITLYVTFLQQYPESGYKADVESEMERAYLDWARQVALQKTYQKAAEQYLVYLEKYPKGNYKTEANDELKQVYVDWSRDTGSQGKTAITDAYESAAKGQAAGIPIFGILKDEPSMAWYSGTYVTLPSDIKATMPGHFRAAVFIEQKVVKVQTCPYIPFGKIIRQRTDWTVKLVNPANGYVRTSRVFSGSTPESCPYRHSFSWSYSTHYHDGGAPSKSAVIEWIREQLGWIK